MASVDLYVRATVSAPENLQVKGVNVTTMFSLILSVNIDEIILYIEKKVIICDEFYCYRDRVIAKLSVFLMQTVW